MWPFGRIEKRKASLLKKHRAGTQEDGNCTPDHKAESARSRPKERHEFRLSLMAPDQWGQDQGKKNHSADPADRRKYMEPYQENHHPRYRSIDEPTPSVLTLTIQMRTCDVLPGNVRKTSGRCILRPGPGALFRVASDQPFGKSKLG